MSTQYVRTLIIMVYCVMSELWSERYMMYIQDNQRMLILIITVPKFAISQSEANSTVLISYDIKSLTVTLNVGLNLGTVTT